MHHKHTPFYDNVIIVNYFKSGKLKINSRQRTCGMCGMNFRPCRIVSFEFI